MLPKIHRLGQQRDFDAVFKLGKIKQDNFFIVRANPNSLNLSRFAVIVSARVAKKAVKRNVLRRRAYEIIRLNISYIRPGFDVLLTAKRPLLNAGYKETAGALASLLKKIGLFV